MAAITSFVAERGGNLLALDQHVELETRTFFVRAVWELERFSVPRDGIESQVRALCEKYGLEYDLSFSDSPRRTAVFASKTPHCLYDLLLTEQLRELGGDIAVVVSNHPDLREVADHFGKAFVHVPMKDKAQAEATHRGILAEHRADLVVLARYMQIMSPAFVGDWQHRIINIHHSFLPAFVGAEAYRQAKERGVKMIGATAHYVTSELDHGPIIEQATVRVSHRDALPDVIRKGRDLERACLTEAVRLHLQRRVIVSGNRTIVFD